MDLITGELVPPWVPLRRETVRAALRRGPAEPDSRLKVVHL